MVFCKLMSIFHVIGNVSQQRQQKFVKVVYAKTLIQNKVQSTVDCSAITHRFVWILSWESLKFRLLTASQRPFQAACNLFPSAHFHFVHISFEITIQPNPNEKEKTLNEKRTHTHTANNKITSVYIACKSIISA